MPKNSEGAAKGVVGWKGIAQRVLDEFAVTQGAAGWRVPYFDREGTLYRVKLFAEEGEELERGGRSRWLGESKPQIPYGSWRMASADKRAVVITEGESDTWALAEAFPKVCALGIPGSGGWKTGWAAVIGGTFDRVYLSVDGDDAGRSLADAIMADLPGRCRYLHMPPGADTRALLQRLGPAAWSALRRHADAMFEAREVFAAIAEAGRPLAAVEEAWARA